MGVIHSNSNVKQRFFQQAEAVIPSEFYDIRAETAPKAGLGPMYAFAGLIYVTAVVSFAFLYSSEASKSIVETVILSYDNTGNDGYTCQMISRVTANYQVESSDLPVLAYNVINVMESKTQCQASLAAANPCNDPLLPFPGTSVSVRASGDIYGAAALYGDNLAFALKSSEGLQLVVKYDYTTGMYGDSDFGVSDLQTNSLAVDLNGSPIYVASDGGPTAKVYRSSIDNPTVDTIHFDTGEPNAMVFNDNLYNVYYAANNSFYALDVYVTPAVSTLLFSLAEGDSFLHAAVYNDGTTPTVYFYSTQTAISQEIHMYHSGTITTVKYNVIDLCALVVDGFNRFYYVVPDHTFYGTLSCYPGEYCEFMNYLKITEPPSGFAINVAGDRILDISTDPVTKLQGMAFMYPLTYEAWLEEDNGVSRIPEEISAVSGFGATWFTCADKVLNLTDYTPGDETAYPYVCADNGLVGDVVFFEPEDAEPYLFTTTDAGIYAVNQSIPYCSALYEPICESVGNLPPYSCSRTIQPGFFTCAASAVANAQFLAQVLVFLAALLLPYLAGMFPAPGDPIGTGSTATGTIIAGKSSNGAAAYQGKDIEMTVVTEVNPMR